MSAKKAVGVHRRILKVGATYLDRSRGVLPMQAAEAPWYLKQNYLIDFFTTHLEPIDDGTLEFSLSQGS